MVLASMGLLIWAGCIQMSFTQSQARSPPGSHHAVTTRLPRSLTELEQSRLAVLHDIRAILCLGLPADIDKSGMRAAGKEAAAAEFEYPQRLRTFAASHVGRVSFFVSPL